MTDISVFRDKEVALVFTGNVGGEKKLQHKVTASSTKFDAIDAAITQGKLFVSLVYVSWRSGEKSPAAVTCLQQQTVV